MTHEQILQEYQWTLKLLGIRLDKNIQQRNYIEQRIREVTDEIAQFKVVQHG